MRIILFSQTGCTACKEVKEILDTVENSNLLEKVDTVNISKNINEIIDTSVSYSFNTVPAVLVVDEENSSIVFCHESKGAEDKTLMSTSFWSDLLSNYS